ncbi:hypothetical protein [Burkholderia pseudomallei]|uniref:Uncharacterized protein n=2 Tax=Burkholderia pseudomallei TaxID=28450 RepID=A0AAX0UB76_BURPE|nr:hypothetical protein [Burkholderia pseudomallei]ABN94010.1 hypothetical protein BURPS1106A_A0235 [Burkholderia pseudomallei 1106a]AFR18163.1 hypothetical protein BPC006_II0224 [Burkholderia pseudomallei BPC006]EDS84776.1 hypothetical protein BURPSS13_J0146 [Burkholderia pseudomallei S13]EES22145.1 hypothetical protein BURPS1106B_1757 [Burkholderia pseudomallei 1106b]ARL53426.1 hypothetical protein BOC51_27095 [Burkholderia pseudomallei]
MASRVTGQQQPRSPHRPYHGARATAAPSIVMHAAFPHTMTPLDLERPGGMRMPCARTRRRRRLAGRMRGRRGVEWLS